MSTNLVELGYIAGAFGIQGWVRIKVYSNPVDSILLQQKECCLSFSGTQSSYRIKSIKVHGDELVCLFEGIHNRNQAEALRAFKVSVDREAFPETDEDTFYWVDLIGCDVYYLTEELDQRLFSEQASEDPDVIDPVAYAMPYMGKVRYISDNGVHAILHICEEVVVDGVAQFKVNARGQYIEQLIPFVLDRVPYVDLERRVILTDIPPEF